jgi:hypothetical protein
MSNQRTTVVLTFLLVSSIILAGCISQQNTGTQAGNVTVTTPSVAPSKTPCPPPGNATQYIIINPIGIHNSGDVVEINGTTNLGINSKIQFYLNEKQPLQVAPGPDVTPTPYYQDFSKSGYVSMKEGTCGTNYWSYTVALPGYHMPLFREYLVLVREDLNRTIYDEAILKIVDTGQEAGG